MTRIRSLPISVATTLVVVVAWASSGNAQSLPSLSRDDGAWQSRRPTDQDDSLRGNSWTTATSDAPPAPEPNRRENPFGGAAWQPAESANAVPQPAPAPTTKTNAAKNPNAKQTRWIAPNGSAPQAPVNAAASAARLPAREPQQFVPPAGAARLSESPVRSNNTSAAVVNSSRAAGNQPARAMQGQQSGPANASNTSAAQPAVRANKSTSSAQLNDSAARNAGVPKMPRGQLERDQLNAAPAPGNFQSATRGAQPGSAAGNRFTDDGSWIHPLRQIAYMTDGPMPSDPSQMELPSPNMAGGDGQWIGGPSGGGDRSCGPSCPCDGAYSCDGGCACGGGPGCCDGCQPGCADEPSCGCSKQTDLFCVGWGDDESCHTIRVRVPRFQEVTVLGGVHGFKGPMDQSPIGGTNRDSGNFGFQEGINIGAKVPFLDWGYQLGFENTQSELSGDANTGLDTSFTQSFVTGGVFHRSPNGLQGGVAWDWLHDERNNGVDLAQVRTELSLVTCGCHECGLMASFHSDNKTFAIPQEEGPTLHKSLQATNQYLLFYRLHGCRGGEGRVFGGVDDDSDGIVGADFLLPMQGCWSLQSEFTYLIPENSPGVIGSQQEAWNVAINLVWHWKGHARECHSNPYRPLFNVADNGSFIVDDRP